MRPAYIRLFIFLLSSVVMSCSATNHLGKGSDCISPYDYGLAHAKTGVDRYQVLLKTHKEALAAGVNVDYTGIDTIRLEIPKKPSPIILTRYNDFKGCVFIVKNTAKKCYLFERREKGTPITIDKQLIDVGDFRAVEELKRGRYLLIVEDGNLWVLQRRGKKYGHTRKDVLLVENGMAKNAVIKPYNNVYSKPKCIFVKLGKEPLIIKNVSIVRAPGCTYLTHIANVAGADDVRFENMSIKTPESDLVDDRGISIYNCTNVKMDNVRIEGTYSHKDHSGYGIFLNNVWNFKTTRLFGEANWGIFGNNNVNVARIDDSQINRFDIHCYGRDIMFKNVFFFDMYNQYSSVFGTISHDHCTFTNFVPVLNDGSYNSFVGHDIVFRDCVFNATEKKNYLIKLSNLGTDVNERKELAVKALPNVSINNLTVNMTEGADYLYLFYTKSRTKEVEGLDNISNIAIDGMTVVEDGKKPFKGMALNNVQLKTAKPVECTVHNVEVRQAGAAVKSTSVSNVKAAVLKANMPLKGGKMVMKNVRGLKQ